MFENNAMDMPETCISIYFAVSVADLFTKDESISMSSRRNFLLIISSNNYNKLAFNLINVNSFYT